LNSRYYDPVVGRFLNADKPEVLQISLEGIENKNLYAYCNNNPIIYKDKTGEVPVLVVKMAVGAAVNLASEWVSASVSGEEFTINDAAYAVVEGAIIAAVTPYIKPAMSVLLEGASAVFHSRAIKGKNINEALGDGIIAMFNLNYSIVGKIDSRLMKKLVFIGNTEKSYLVVKGLFEYTENVAGLAVSRGLNNKANTNLEKKSPGKCHTRLWYKEREM
jgi:hypothetical protein